MTLGVLCVVVHDVAGATLAACERLIGAVGDVGPVPLTFLAVPRFHHDAPTPQLEQWLGERSRGGDEIALHGYTHLDEGTPHGWVDRLRRRVYTRGEGEFWDLAPDDAALRLKAGMGWFARNGWPLRGFVAPAWLLGPGAWQALRASRVSYTATLRHIHLLHGRERITSQSLVYSTSSAWRRLSSVVWAHAVAARQAANPVLRLELHPHDADHPAVRGSWQRLLERQLRGREALTVAQIVDRRAGLRAD
ncbi:MAG TPA: polysaccharide deacetylase family protein [Caldimonas sp.]